jgi:hypothetical protein
LSNDEKELLFLKANFNLMKRHFLPIVLMLLTAFYSFGQSFSPYFKIGNLGSDIGEVSEKLKTSIADAGYDILGSYAPGKQSDLYVIVFTNDVTKTACQDIGSQGLIAATYRIGLEKTTSGVVASSVDPSYQWRAYLNENFENASASLAPIATAYMNFCKSIGNGHMDSFGGVVDEDDLLEYHYMMGMPYYEDQVTIKEFNSYSDAKSAIEKNLTSAAGVQHVFTLSNDQKQVAIYGIGLTDQEIGESHFLSIIGQSHVAALPYELIVDGKKVKMLHGRFRFALYWPELTMGTFTKIMSTPGDVEDMMERLVK